MVLTSLLRVSVCLYRDKVYNTREIIMSCVVQWCDVLFVKGMHFSSKNACLLNYNICQLILS